MLPLIFWTAVGIAAFALGRPRKPERAPDEPLYRVVGRTGVSRKTRAELQSR